MNQDFRSPFAEQLKTYSLRPRRSRRTLGSHKLAIRRREAVPPRTLHKSFVALLMKYGLVSGAAAAARVCSTRPRDYLDVA